MCFLTKDEDVEVKLAFYNTGYRIKIIRSPMRHNCSTQRPSIMNRNLANHSSVTWYVSFVLIFWCQVTFSVERHEFEAFYLHDGDRVVFYGDSITEQAHYTLPIEIYLALRRHELDVSFVNSGWSGDHAWGGEGGMLAERIERDILAHKPTVVTVMLGMNDGYYTNFDQKALDAFSKSVERLVQTLKVKLPGVRITLIGTSPYDNITPGKQPDWETVITGGYDSVVVLYSNAMRELARKNDLLFVDMHEPLVKLLKELQASQPDLARELIPDRIHPGKAAGLVMAARLLDAWRIAQVPEARVIDGSKMQYCPLVVSERWPVEFPLVQDDKLTRYLISRNLGGVSIFAPAKVGVTNLPMSQFSLRINGQDLGSFSAGELKSGVEFESDHGIGQQVKKLIELENRLRFISWRSLPTNAAETEPVVQEFAEVKDQLTGLQKELAVPTQHVLEVKRID